MKLLFEHPKAVIQLNEETNSIELHWKLQQDPETYKIIFQKVFEFIGEYKTTGFLSDIRKEGVVGPDSANWLQTEMMPKAFAIGLSKVAVVMDEDIFKEFYIKNVEKTAGNDRVKHFDNEEQAKTWLLN